MTVTLVLTVKKEIEIPDDIKNEDEVREYLRRAYDDNELVKYPDEVIIEEIEDCPTERDEFDDFDDRWHSGEFIED